MDFTNGVLWSNEYDIPGLSKLEIRNARNWLSVFQKCRHAFLEIVGTEAASELFDLELESVDTFLVKASTQRTIPAIARGDWAVILLISSNVFAMSWSCGTT